MAQMLNNSVTVHTGNSTSVSWEVQLSDFNKFPSPVTCGGIRLFPVSFCNVKYSEFTGQFKQSQGKNLLPCFSGISFFFYQLFPI